MLFGRYFKYIAAFLTTLLVSEQIPAIKTIDPGPSEASQLPSALSEFANVVKDNIVEIVTRPSDFFHGNENNQSPIVLEPPLPPPPPPASLPLESPPESPPEPPPESLQAPEPMPMADHTPRLLRVDGSKIILELDLERVPGFNAVRNVAYLFGILFSGGLGVSREGQSYWMHALVPAALGFFGGLGYGFVGWCRWCLSRREAPRAVEQAVIPKKTERKTPANAYFESRLSQSYMMPLNFQNLPDPRRLRVPASIAATKSEQVEETTIGGIAKKEEDADPLMVPSSLSDSFWYSPESPLSPTQLNGKGLDLSSYDGFQPKPKISRPNDLPETLLGSFPLVASPPRPRKPSLPQISDPWSNYTPDNRVQLS